MSEREPERSPEGAEQARGGAEDARAAGAVAALVESHREFLRFLERKVGNRAIAEDILQDAFVRGIGRIDSLRDEESATAWFYRTLRNAVVDHFRRKGASERAMAALAAELDEATQPEVEHRAVCQCVRVLAGTLKPEYAAAIQRVEVDGLSVQAFAEEASITANNAAVRLFRAREALRKQVVASCGSCAEHGCLDCTCAPVPPPQAKGEPEPKRGCGHGHGGAG
ncbi:ECF-family RNA polymerase sigma factor [Sorangium cellulosum So ce56]|uniref:ECF-family RNA polymerase sigma factor n=1 Tax=Sorangium cellulosum (strain So ce56) TaxID=448385 RepID=A9FNG2_SORC5|nr:sigma-70 family RNA polymerase sigma factor [Sorangium cellulosum]CAN98421.1 ECF-family RNA polymerase sigma factor [Sorangium cellulosum So ce56]